MLEKHFFMLSELNSSENEVWGERNNSARLQYEGYREALKKNKLKENELKNVSMTTLEFSQAERMIVDQKRKIGELEIILKKIQEQNETAQRSINQERGNLDKFKADLNKQNVTLQDKIQQQRHKQVELEKFIRQVVQLTSFERIKRKLLQQKAFALQEGLRKAENYIITVDSLYSKALKEDLLEGVVNEDIVRKIEKFKLEHKHALLQFRDGYDILMQNEKKIKAEMKNKKNSLKPEIIINQEWKNHLSRDARALF